MRTVDPLIPRRFALGASAIAGLFGLRGADKTRTKLRSESDQASQELLNAKLHEDQNLTDDQKEKLRKILEKFETELNQLVKEGRLEAGLEAFGLCFAAAISTFNILDWVTRNDVQTISIEEYIALKEEGNKPRVPRRSLLKGFIKGSAAGFTSAATISMVTRNHKYDAEKLNQEIEQDLSTAKQDLDNFDLNQPILENTDKNRVARLLGLMLLVPSAFGAAFAYSQKSIFKDYEALLRLHHDLLQKGKINCPQIGIFNDLIDYIPEELRVNDQAFNIQLSYDDDDKGRTIAYQLGVLYRDGDLITYDLNSTPAAASLVPPKDIDKRKADLERLMDRTNHIIMSVVA